MLTDNDGTVTTAAVAPVAPWQNTQLPADERVADLLGRMTLEEKLAQLYGAWIGQDSATGDVAPHQHDFADEVFDWKQLIEFGLGQLTRPFGTAPVDPGRGAAALVRRQAEVMAAGRFGIPALTHDECLAGFTTWQATIYPTPLAWGATFDAELVERMAAQIGAAMRDVGVHQGLAPVLDVARDPRWGRTEETIGEDPYLVATIGTAYVRGLESTGVIATLKHFVAYSGSRAGRNFAPVAAGPRELADIFLPPFEMAVRDGGARSVMQSYVDVDGVPVAAHGELLTNLLRRAWGFDGTVVSDYFAVSFLQSQHGVAGSEAEAAGLALAAGVDVELPNARCYGEPLLAAVRANEVSEALVDRAASRVLRQKCELGMLDPDWSPVPPALSTADGAAALAAFDEGEVDQLPSGLVDLDPAPHREVARRLAEESVVLLANDGTLPLGGHSGDALRGHSGDALRGHSGHSGDALRGPGRLAVVGPLAHDPMAMMGCYSFPSHVGIHHPELPLGVDVPTVLDALRAELPAAAISHAYGCGVDDPDPDGIAAAVAAAEGADVCVAVLGDRAGLFGNGTSGEGCDTEDLRLPGIQGELLEALLATGTPVVLVLLTGRPYALGAYADRLAASVMAFFPGEEGGPAVAGVLTGRVSPSGRLPIGVPRGPGGQPASYLAAALGHRTEVSTVDPSALYPFGHGLSYTSFDWDDPRLDRTDVPTDGTVSVSVTVRNTGPVAGCDVVQLYLHDPVAQVTRPVVRLIGYARVELAPGQARRVTFGVGADLTSFAGRDGHRVVEPGELELQLSRSSGDVRHALRLRLVGDERMVDHRRVLTATVAVTEVPGADV